jgi:hypothetical protein
MITNIIVSTSMWFIAKQKNLISGLLMFNNFEKIYTYIVTRKIDLILLESNL